MIYLDAAATANYQNKDDIIVDTITTVMRDSWMNPSSLYASNVREKINKCRANISKFIGAEPEDVYFTSGSSESNNWAIRGWIDNMLSNNYGKIHIITTLIEHKSILKLLENNDALEAKIHYCNIDGYGFVDYQDLERLLCKYQDQSILVSINMANNEIGTIQSVRMLSDLVHKYGGVIHTDATQALGHIPINVKELNIDMMSCSGHKISPVLRGIGFLYKKNNVNIRPLIYGIQENALRGGTENTYGIIGLSKAIEYCNLNNEKEMCNKRNYFIDLLESKFGCTLNGHSAFRLPNNINVTFHQNITGESLLYILDMSGVKISVGSACNSHSYEPSHVLKAIGLSDEESMKTVRFSLSYDIEYKDIDDIINEIDKAIKIIEIN